MSTRVIVIYCGLLLSLSAFSVDITLPAFPLIVADLAAPYDLVQMTVTIYILSLGVGQLLCGSLSDRFGRRPIILGGLLVFLLGALLAIFATNIYWLLAGRVLQGVGAAAGPVLGRAIIRDLFSGRELARNMAFAMAVFAFGPIVAPLVGVGLIAIGGWRFVYIGIAIFVIFLLIALTRLPETLKATNAAATNPVIMWGNMVRLFRQPQSRFFLLLSGTIMTSMLLIVTNAPRVFEQEFGITGTLFAILFALHGVGIVIGQTVNRNLIGRIGALWSAVAGNGVLVLTGALIVALGMMGIMSGYLLSALLVLFATSYLMVYSNAASLTLDPHGEMAGFASSFYGFFSQLLGSVAASVLSIFIAGRLIPWGSAILLVCVICLMALVLRGRAFDDR